MATSPNTKVPEDSFDTQGVSVVVSNRRATNQRYGCFFDSDFAAASPIYFQNIDANKFVGVFSERWSDAVRHESATDPNLFLTYTRNTEPSWTIFDGINGQHYPLPAQAGITAPTNITGYTSRVAVGACSRTNTYLFVLQRVTKGGSTFGVLTHYFINPVTWQVNLLGEEQISNVTVGRAEVSFTAGIGYGSPELFIAGTDTEGNIYLARKNWGYVGRISKIEYQTDKGWTENPSNAVPLKASDGTNLKTAGPISMATWRGKTWIMVVQNNGGNMSAQGYASRGLYDSWTPENNPYPLGTLGSTYMGGTVYFQPSLRAQGSVSESAITGIPVVYSTKAVSQKIIDGSTVRTDGINISWDMWPIPISGNTRVIQANAPLDITVSPTINFY